MVPAIILLQVLINLGLSVVAAYYLMRNSPRGVTSMFFAAIMFSIIHIVIAFITAPAFGAIFFPNGGGWGGVFMLAYDAIALPFGIISIVYLLVKRKSK